VFDTFHSKHWTLGNLKDVHQFITRALYEWPEFQHLRVVYMIPFSWLTADLITTDFGFTPPQSLVGVNNGVVNKQDLTFRPARPLDMITSYFKFNYNPDVDISMVYEDLCELIEPQHLKIFHQFIRLVLLGQQPSCIALTGSREGKIILLRTILGNIFHHFYHASYNGVKSIASERKNWVNKKIITFRELEKYEDPLQKYIDRVFDYGSSVILEFYDEPTRLRDTIPRVCVKDCSISYEEKIPAIIKWFFQEYT
jgi:hypothetical protein